jgi:prepilin-type N-terminal cleavage/methylation domain-containing protein
MRKGFTIIEILVVMVILGVIMAVGSVRYRDFQRRQIVVSVKREMLGDVRSAQSDVSSGRKPDACTGTLLGYEFEITSTNPGAYRINAVCSSGDILVKQVNLPPGVTLSVSGSNTVLFKPLSHGTDLSAGSNVTITITNSVNTNTLVISASGEIR